MVGRGEGGNKSRDGGGHEMRTTVPCVLIRTLKEEKPVWFTGWQETNSKRQKKKKFEIYLQVLVFIIFFSCFLLHGSPSPSWGISLAACQWPSSECHWPVRLSLLTWLQAGALLTGWNDFLQNSPWMQRVCWLARWLEWEDPANREPALLSRLGPKALFSWNPLGQLPSDFSIPCSVRSLHQCVHMASISTPFLSEPLVSASSSWSEYKSSRCGNCVFQFFISFFYHTFSHTLCAKSIY